MNEPKNAKRPEGEFLRVKGGCGVVEKIFHQPTHQAKPKGGADNFLSVLVHQPNGQKMLVNGTLKEGEAKVGSIIAFAGDLMKRDAMKDGKPVINEKTGKPFYNYSVENCRDIQFRKMKNYESPILSIIWSGQNKKNPEKFDAIVEIDPGFEGGKTCHAQIQTEGAPVVGAKLSIEGVLVQEPSVDKENGNRAKLMQDGKTPFMNLAIHAFETKMEIPEQVAQAVADAQPLPNANSDDNIPWDDESEGPSPS